MNSEFFREHKRSIKVLKMLRKSPPRVLIIEGGRSDDRVEIGKYWSALVNCSSEHSAPCFECNICKDILEERAPDLYVLNGKDESIKIDQVRVVHRDRDIRPRQANFKIFLFYESQNLTIQAANSLLKVLEEPEEKNLFVLLVPQRTLLLPTIISRSFILTLKWKIKEFDEESIKGILKNLEDFWLNGKGLFNVFKGKKIDRSLIKEIVFFLQRSLLDSLIEGNNIIKFFGKNISAHNFWNVTYILNQANNMLDTNLSAEDIFYWLALNLYSLFNLS